MNAMCRRYAHSEERKEGGRRRRENAQVGLHDAWGSRDTERERMAAEEGTGGEWVAMTIECA